MIELIESTAQQVAYEWLESEMWEYMSWGALSEIGDEDTPCVQQLYAQLMGWC